MRFWIRELGGWALILFGFFFFYMSCELVLQAQILYVWPVAIIGLVVFRGGIHLLKVAVAARICQQAQDRLYPVPPPARRPGS
jgi:hypothetical protein